MLLGFGPGWVEVEVLVVALVVVEDHLEHPLVCVRIRLDQARDPVAVFDALQVAVGRAHAVALVGLSDGRRSRSFSAAYS